MHTREAASGILKLMNIVEKVKDNLDSSEVPRSVTRKSRFGANPSFSSNYYSRRG